MSAALTLVGGFTDSFDGISARIKGFLPVFADDIHESESGKDTGEVTDVFVLIAAGKRM